MQEAFNITLYGEINKEELSIETKPSFTSSMSCVVVSNTLLMKISMQLQILDKYKYVCLHRSYG